ncbi:hypothetical protein PUNSTDRAFT_46879 [Punctularia strigosozonata HHB-11173 SS5]|uniref:uncharacterized protein n=1 Tax=Punctularia strigosozonata (strain HHB-11173) TaxID=741275 RepID=UPI000441696B|nr:uncharacterized protein PUNSTDRAFT_46879 [Punctularia strigosozonata HHB-11173 SS5]EIN05543.1 hypothetical protein PUNSTDRAFT_46879 [Punctularia strigosozonata HHB-11173 SS5]
MYPAMIPQERRERIEKSNFGRAKNKVHTEDVRSVQRTEPPLSAVGFQAEEQSVKVRPPVAIRLELGEKFIKLPEEIEEALPPSEPIGLNETMEKISQQLASDIIQKIPNHQNLHNGSYTIMPEAERGNANWLWFQTLDLSCLFSVILVKKVERKAWETAVANIPLCQCYHLRSGGKVEKSCNALSRQQTEVDRRANPASDWSGLMC